MELSSQHTDTNQRNQEWLMLAKKADSNSALIEQMVDLLAHIDPYENKSMLPRCCAQFGYIAGLRSLVLTAPNADWDRVMSAAVMGNQKKSVEFLLAHIDPQLSIKEDAINPSPNQSLRLSIENGQQEILQLLIAVVPEQQRTNVLLWALEEYNYAVQNHKPVELLERSIQVLYPTTNAIKLLHKDSGLPLNTPARDFLSDLLAKNVKIIGEMNLNITLRKIRQ